MTTPPKKDQSMEGRIIGLIERLFERSIVTSGRLRNIEDRLARMDGGDDSKAALDFAQKQVADRLKALRAHRP